MISRFLSCFQNPSRRFVTFQARVERGLYGQTRRSRTVGRARCGCGARQVTFPLGAPAPAAATMEGRGSRVITVSGRLFAWLTICALENHPLSVSATIHISIPSYGFRNLLLQRRGKSLHRTTTQNPPIRGKDVLILNTFILVTLSSLVLMQSRSGAPFHTSRQARLKP